MIRATSIIVMPSTRGNSIELELSGINSSSLIRTGAGARENAITPIVIAPRFLPKVFDIRGASTKAHNADRTALNVIAPICLAEKPHRNVHK